MSKKWTYEQIADSHIYYIKEGDKNLAAADEPTAKAVVDACEERAKLLFDEITKARIIADDNRDVTFEIARLLDLDPAQLKDADPIRAKIAELKNRPVVAPPAPRQKWREPVENFIATWDGIDMTQRSNELAPFVKKLRNLLNGK